MSTSKKAAAPRKTKKRLAAPPVAKAVTPAPIERFIVLLRHGIAEEPSPDKKDEDRSLTIEGHARMKEIARGLERALPKVQVVCTSPLLRAVQTALWVSKAYRSRVQIHTTDALAPGASRKQFLALIESIEAGRAILVGHEPNLSDNLAALVALDESSIELKKGGCYGLRLREDRKASLEWLLPPRVLRKLGE
jgi:phosphohistidine phosphatase